VLVAVSTTADPTLAFNVFSINTTNDGTDGLPSHPGCPCIGDQPLIGADKNGFYVTTNEFGLAAPTFNGAQVYATSKDALIDGAPGPVVLFDNNPLAEGIAFSVQPAIAPPGASPGSQEWDEDDSDHASANGVEYFLSSLDFSGTVDNRVAVWALSNTASLASATPALSLTHVVITSETYGQPPPATQKDGPRPLGALVGEPVEFLNTNDDRMNQVVFAHGNLYGGLNTIIQSPSGAAPTAGIAWFQVKPKFGPNGLRAKVQNQGYVTIANNNVMFPSIGVNHEGQGAIVFSLSGPDFFPSVGYTKIGEDDDEHLGIVHIVAAGQLPDDGFTGYVALSGSNVARWGDYSAASAAIADNDGTIWLAGEYIPNAPRSQLANWGTFVAHFTEE
jgi:hypothetical protein